MSLRGSTFREPLIRQDCGRLDLKGLCYVRLSCTQTFDTRNEALDKVAWL